MSGCEQFPLGTASRARCEGSSQWPIAKVNRWRVSMGIEPLPDDASDVVTVNDQGVATARVAPNRAANPSGGSGCGGCGSNSVTRPVPEKRTPEGINVGSRKATDFVIRVNGSTKTTPSRIRQKNTPASFLSRAAQYTAAMARHIADDGAASSPETLAFRESCCKACPHNVDNLCVLCSCPLVKNALNDGKLSWRSEACPVGKWFRQTDRQQPLIEPIRNLIFHIFPRVGCEWNWHRHVQHIVDNQAIWNGKRVISIGTGEGLASVDSVKNQFGDVRVDHWVVMPNSAVLGETEPFVPSLKLVESVNPNEVTMYGHTKGITHPQDAKEQIWSEIMWEVCTDLQSVDDALASHAMAGPFKRHMKYFGTNYHYSGGFFWLRHKDIFSQKTWPIVLQRRSGMEFWPEKVCPNNLAAPLFHDDPPLSFLDAGYWDKEVLPEFENWQAARGL